MAHPGTPHSAAADPLELYRWAVQDPETHATVLRVMFERLHPGHTPRTLREDFAGTSAEAVAWLALGPGRQALAVDCHAPTVAWARQRARRILGTRADSLQFVEADVLAVGPPAVPSADILSVLNFSILYLREPEQLRAYLHHAWHCLSAPGLLVLNVYGGSEALRVHTDRHLVTPRPRLATEAPVAPFEYFWEQRQVDPQTRRLDCRIHFRISQADGGRGMLELRDAFRYDWRLWTLAELIAALQEAGFENVQVWRHTYDPSKGTAGVFLGAVPPAAFETQALWTAYVVASRGARPAASPPST